jgi:hypothetical protein
MKRLTYLFLIAMLVIPAAPASALEDENLLVSLRDGYKIGFQKKTGNQIISEMVPSAETVESWTEMVTVQIFLSMRDVTPVQYRTRLETLWANACTGSTFSTVKDGVENGYPTLTWLQKCPLNKQTGKPELTWMKAVQGRDSFYLVQKAFKFTPSPEQTKRWGEFLDGVRVCDTRLPDRPCRLAR